MPGSCNPEEIWPNRTEVQEQLFGNLEQLRQMTMYITEVQEQPGAAPPDDNVIFI
jgi:hypothetical protein